MSETGVNLFDYVNSKEVFVQSVYSSKCLIVELRAMTNDEQGNVQRRNKDKVRR